MLQAASFACYPERVRVKGEEKVSPDLAVGGKWIPMSGQQAPVTSTTIS